MSVAVSAWTSNTTQAGYEWAANAAASGMTTSLFPIVVFNVTDANSGNFSPVA